MHLVVIAAGVGVAAWALIALRKGLPRGRYLVFGGASAAAVFGCAAIAGEVGLLPPAAWFAVLIGGMIGIASIARRWNKPESQPA
jgi:hypothetical protein